MIEVVDEKDLDRLFDILCDTAVKFTQFGKQKFRIDDNEQATLKKIKKSGIQIQ